MSLVLAEPSTPQRVDIPHDDEVQFGHADVPASSQLLVNEFRLENPANLLMATMLIELAIGIEVGAIDHLDEVGYALLRPIPYRIEQLRAGDFLATFADANIGIGGVDAQDAYQSLIAEILDTFDTLISQERLSTAAVQQLRVLQTYLVRA
jgi:hypothetical protein